MFRKLLVCGVLLAISTTAAFAQPAAPLSPQTYVPITLDWAKMRRLMTSVPMVDATRQELANLLDEWEQDAKAKAAASGAK